MSSRWAWLLWLARNGNAPYVPPLVHTAALVGCPVCSLCWTVTPAQERSTKFKPEELSHFVSMIVLCLTRSLCLTRCLVPLVLSLFHSFSLSLVVSLSLGLSLSLVLPLTPYNNPLSCHALSFTLHSLSLTLILSLSHSLSVSLAASLPPSLGLSPSLVLSSTHSLTFVLPLT